MNEQIKITIVCDAKTGQVLQVQGPLEMKAFMVHTFATAIQIVVNHAPEAPELLIPVNGNGKEAN